MLLGVGVVLAEDVGLLEADALVLAEDVGVAFGLAFLLGVGVVGFAQLVAEPAGVLLAAGLETVVAIAVVVAALLSVALLLSVAVLLALALALSLGLPVALLLPGAGLAGELGGGVDGLGGGLDELVFGLVFAVGEAGADDGAHDEAGAGAGCFAVGATAPPPRTLPGLPGAAEAAALVDPEPPKASDTDELSAVRSGATDAKTTPTATTAQARAMAGLISASRQRLAGRRA